MSQQNKRPKFHGDMIDMDHLLNGLSYTQKDQSPHQPDHENSFTIKELPNQESRTDNQTAENGHTKDITSEIQLELPPVYPCPAASYNPKRCPPDLKQAEKHGQAHSVMKFNPMVMPDELCESTGIPVNQKKLSLFCSMEKLFYLGPVLPMYFVYLKQLAVFTFLLTGIGIFALFFRRVEGVLNYRALLKELVTDDKKSFMFVLLLFCFMVNGFFLLYFFRRGQKTTKMACKKTMVTPSDYSIMAYNMGRVHTEEEARHFFATSMIHGFSLDVQKVVITYNIEKYVKKVRELKALFAQKTEAEKNANYLASGMLEDLHIKIEQINQFFTQNKKLLTGCKGFKRNGLCFVTFSNKQEAKSVRRKFEFSILERGLIWLLEKCTDEFPEYFFRDHYIKVEKAPEMNEIIWENLNSNRTKFGPTFFSRLLCLTLVIAICISLILIRKYLFDNSPYEIYFRCALIAITNEFLALIIHFSAKYEPFKTITSMSIAIEKRIAIFQFLNSALPILLMDKFLLERPMANLPYHILIMISATSFFPLFLRAINITYHLKQYQKRSLIKKVTNSSNPNLTQEEANSTFELPEFDVLRVYADANRTLLVCSLFFALSPAVAPIALASFAISYYLDKFNLIRRSLLPTSLRSEIAEEMFEFLDIALFLVFIGVNFFLDLLDGDPDAENGCHTLNIFAIVLSLTYLVLPNKRFARNCFQKKKKMAWRDVLVYPQAFEYFGKDYQNTNMITKDSFDNTPQQLKETYKTTLEHFNAIDILQDIPEILPLFEYANKRPSLPELSKKEFSGIRNPFYTFPYNYGYADDPNVIHQSETSSTPKTPLLKDGGQTPTKKGRKRVKLNEMVPSSYSVSMSLDNRSRMSDSRSAKGNNSIIKDIMMIPSFYGRGEPEFQLHVSSLVSPAFGPAKQELPRSVPQEFNLDHIAVQMESQETPAALDGISPISGTFKLDAKDGTGL